MESQYKSQLKSIVLNLRHILEGRYDDAGVWHPGDLEERLAALGVRRDREAMALEQLSHLSEEDHRTRQIVDVFIQSNLKSGQAREEAIHEFLQESAYTWANRLIALRCMEARGLIDEIILQKENYGGRSLRHHRLARQNPELCAGEDDGLYAVLFAEFADRAGELPLLFRSDEPVIALKPGVAALKSCIRLLSAPDEIFTAADALGWAYQYWNTEEKDRVFAKVRTVKGAKIEKLDIIPVTQLYTEPYMVKFLVQNSLGALWMAMHPDSHLCESWAYYVRDADRAPVERKPLKQVSFLDLCVGSGHFLLEAFDLLYAMYQEERELENPAEICEAILSHNLYGIDIDERAIQIAALALYMKAKEKDRDFRPKHINLVATNIHPDAETDHLSAFLAKHPEDEPLQNTLRLIFDSLQHADELGALLQIEEPVEKEFRFRKTLDDEEKAGLAKQPALFQELEKPEQPPLPLGVQSYEEWKTGLLARLSAHFQEELVSADFSSRFFGETAGKGLSLFDFISRRYDVVATNPPYMGSKNMGSVVKRYVEKHFPSGKRDLYAAFILRCLELARPETGRVAMVTQQSWMFLRSFADLRALDEEKFKRAVGFKGILRETSIETLAHLGPGAFGEISGEVVNTVLFTLAKKPPATDHRLTAFRLIGPKGPEEKDAHLRNGNHSVLIRPLQSRFLTIPQAPVCYWLRERFFDLLAGKTLEDVARVPEGLGTREDARFVRFTWEVPSGEWSLPVRTRRWVPFEKGGGYGKWFGHHFWVVDWANGGARIKTTPNPRVQNEQHYFKEGWTYSSVARGSLGFRFINGNAIISDNSAGVIPKFKQENLGVILNCRQSSFIARAMAQSLAIRESYISRIPIGETLPISFGPIEGACVALKRLLVAYDLTERNFAGPSSSDRVSGDFLRPTLGGAEAAAAILHALEGVSEGLIFDSYGIAGDDLQAVVDETGTPAGWFPLIPGYDALPPLPKDLPEIPDEVLASLNNHERRAPKIQELAALKSRLHALYEAGPGAREEVDDTDGEASDDDEEENEQVAVGARIPIPAETFLEELSQKIEIHPISIYWLLKEGIEQDDWRCLPEEQCLTKDRFMVLILRLLGHRWPKQIEKGEPVPEWADEDGIIPLMEGSEEATLYQRLRERLAAEHGDQQVSTEENAFAEIMGKSLNEWVKKDFFRHHISQFKKRPIAWHLTSARWTSRPRQEASFECLVYYHKTDGNLLPKIRSHYVGPLMKRLELELRGLENGSGGGLTGEQENRKALLQDRIPELKTFDRVLSDVIANGFGAEDMKSMLRQYAVNDAMLCLKARWLKKLSAVIQDGPLANRQEQADQADLHPDFSAWISEAIAHLDHHCHVVGPKPPEEKTLDTDPTSKELAGMICAEAEAMLTDALKCACTVWWKSFDSQVLKPVSEKIRDAKKELQSLKEQSLNPKSDFKEHSEIKRKTNVLKSDIKVWQNELALKTGQGKSVRDIIESWRCPEALTWEPWLAEQEMYDQLSSLNAKRPPPRTIREFVQQESLYHPDINDGVRVNITPLQMAGLLTADVLAGKDVGKAIADRAAWRDDERRWCREGKLPKPGWWA
jgi:hypothetical protein